MIAALEADEELEAYALLEADEEPEAVAEPQENVEREVWVKTDSPETSSYHSYNQTYRAEIHPT